MREGLTEYLENALPLGRRQGLERHLTSCKRCRTLLHEVQQLIHVTRALPAESMPPGMKAALLQAYRDAET